jgi:hypothetical protein
MVNRLKPHSFLSLKADNQHNKEREVLHMLISSPKPYSCPFKWWDWGKKICVINEGEANTKEYRDGEGWF